MLTTCTKRDLFGGALRCAGLATATCMSSSALADVSPATGLNYTVINMLDQSGGVLVDDSDITGDAIFPSTTSYAGLGGVISSYSSATLLGVHVTSGDPQTWGYATARVLQYFTVSSDKEMVLEWDFIDAAGPVRGYVYAFGIGSIADVNSGAGSMSLTVLPGLTYVFAGRATIDSAGGLGEVYVRLSNIPAPSALALVGLGMIGTRRRRRE